MTIPGNVTALLVLVAVVIACTGYAAGRLHQWYRTDEDRDEAYREGYDTATRSTFSMAARIIGPRRERSAARGSATVHAPAWRPGPAPATAAGSAAGPAGPDTWCPAKPSGLVGGSPAESAGRAAETAAGPSPDLPFPAPPPASASAPPPSRGSFARSLSRAVARSRRFHSIFPSSSFPPAPSNTSAPSITSRSASANPSSGVSRSPFGPSSPVTPSSASESWAPDTPRSPIAGSLPGVSSLPVASSLPGALSAEHQQAAGDAATAGPEPAAEAGKPSRPGRHFVPDELVRAETYRLTPDRVARAKVPNADAAPPAADDNPAGPPSVPRPRSS